MCKQGTVSAKFRPVEIRQPFVISRFGRATTNTQKEREKEEEKERGSRAKEDC